MMIKVYLLCILERGMYDVNVILGNLLDNALENAKSNSKVNLDIKYNVGMLQISMSNLYDGNVKRLDGHIVSKKGDNHGYGLENIKRIVSKYEGSLVIDGRNERFETDIILYIDGDRQSI